MTDFYPMVLAALSKLGRNTEEARQALFERARTTLAARLRKLDPPLSEQRIMEERLAFEEAVRRAEADWARGEVERELLSKLANTIEQDTPGASQRPGKTWTHLSGTLQQAASGAWFEYGKPAFAFTATGTEADRAAAADPLARSIRSELEYKARDLVGRASRLSDRALWSGLIDPLRMFVEHIGGSEAEVGAGIGTLWALYVALGAHTDSQEDTAPGGIFAPPEADVLRALRDLVVASGPWIRTFPSARAFDDQTRAHPSEIVDAATIFLRGAEQAKLLGDETAAVVRAVLEGAHHHGAFAEKARDWAILTATNLGIAMLVVLAAIARAYESGTQTAEAPEAARAIERLVLQHEEHLLRLFSHLPDGIRDELRAAIEAIRASAEDDV